MNSTDKERLANMNADEKVKVVSDFVGVIPYIGHSPIKESDNKEVFVETANMVVSQNFPVDVKLAPIPVPITITLQPQATVVVQVGAAINITATATGADTHSWFKGATKVKDGVGNNAQFSKASAVSGDAGTYTVEFYNTTVAPVKSGNSVVTVNPAA